MRVTYEVDNDDATDLKNLAYKLLARRKKILSRKGFDGIDFNGSNVHAAKVLPLFEEIFQTDVSTVYSTPDMLNNYYVYVHCDPTKKTECCG